MRLVKEMAKSMRLAAFAAWSLLAFGAIGTASAQDLAPVKVTFIQHCCSGATFFQPMQFGVRPTRWA